MSILTSAMKTNRVVKDFPSLQLFFPFNDGSGNSVSCIKTGASVSDSGTADHNTAHAVEITTSVNTTATGLNKAKLKKHGIALAVFEQPAIVAALCSQQIGDGSGGFSLNATSTQLLTTTSNFVQGAVGGSAATGDIVATAIAWDDTNMYSYYGEDADLALADTDAMPAALIADLVAGTEIGEYVTFQSSTQGAIFGIVCFSFEDELPSDLLTGLNWMKDQWLVGNKDLYPEWRHLK